MARTGVRIRTSSHVAPRRAWTRDLIVVAVLGLSSIATARCEGAGIARYLTPRDRSSDMLLSETGQPIAPGSPTHPGTALSPENRPAYAVFPLYGGEHLPAGIPTLTASPQAGETPVGPLDLTPMVQANLNAALNASTMAVVQTPTRSYAVEYLPRYAQIEAHQSSSATSSTSPSATNPSSLAALASNLTIEGVPASEITHWLKTQSKGFLEWTSSGLADLEKALKISRKSPAPKPSKSLAAQALVPPLANSTGAALPAPVPEPGTWLVCGVILGAAGLRKWAGKLRGSRHVPGGLPHGIGQASASAATAQPLAATEMN